MAAAEEEVRLLPDAHKCSLCQLQAYPVLTHEGPIVNAQVALDDFEALVRETSGIMEKLAVSGLPCASKGCFAALLPSSFAALLPSSCLILNA